MLDGLLVLRGTEQRAAAAHDRFPFDRFDLRAAGRAAVRHHEGFGRRRAQFGQAFHDFGYDIARSPDDDGIADADVLPADFVGVVQGGVGHGDAADEHRF